MATPAPAPKNLYHLRRVADSAAKPCFICYRQSSTVLITPDQSDFFYTCPGHLTDPGFCAPVGPSAEELRKRELEREVERVKREYEEKMKKKQGKDKDKDKDKDKKGGDDDKEKEGKGKGKDKDGKKEDEKPAEATTAAAAPAPRVFTLHKKVYEMRLARLRQIAQAKRNQQMMKSPGFWPSVPKGGV